VEEGASHVFYLEAGWGGATTKTTTKTTTSKRPSTRVEEGASHVFYLEG
jgi:hypothetical protein